MGILTNRELKSLLNITLHRKVLILMPTEESASAVRDFLRAQVKAEYPTLCNSCTITGRAVCIKYREPVTVATAKDWRSYIKYTFNGIVLVDDDMFPDDYVPLPFITESPEKLHKYLGERII